MSRNTVYAPATERGMTIMELMVAMLISSILVILMFQFFSSQANSFMEARQTAEMQQELRWALTYLSDHLKLAGNGMPPTSGWNVLENVDGSSSDPDTVKVMASYKSLIISTTLDMTSTASQVRVDDASGIEIGDLAVISDGTFQEIFMITGITAGNNLSHDASLPWNDDNRLDHTYDADSTVSIVTYYYFFIQQEVDGSSNLMVETQYYSPQVLLGDVDDFQIRFKLKDGSWVDETDETRDIRLVEIAVRARSPEPLKDYIDQQYGDAYKRLEMKTLAVPQNIYFMDRI